MRSLLERLAHGRYVVFGRAGMDIYATPNGTKSEQASRFDADLGGSSANICAGLCKLGMQAALVTSVSNDAVGRFCLNKLKDYGVDTQYIRSIDGEYRTSLAVYESRLDDFQNVIYRNNAADFQVSERDVERVDYDQYDVLVTAGTVFASEPSRSATFRAFELAKQAGKPIVFDIDYRPYSWPSPEVAAEVLSQAGALSDVIVGNDEEFGFMAGSYDAGLQKARALAGENRIVVYKMGGDGAITFIDGKEVRTGIYRVEALKPVGAGDSFLAGFLAALAQGKLMDEAVLRGSACAAIVVSQPGCAPAMPNNDTLDAFLQAHQPTSPT